MRKKSHILLARCIADNLILYNIDDSDLQYHRFAFCLGSVLPDCRPSFLTEKHAYNVNFDKVAGKMKRLAEQSSLDKQHPASRWIAAGEITHYIADYFTFPHNTNFPGNIADHCRYEEELKDTMKACVLSGKADEYCRISGKFGSCREIEEFIKKEHDVYMQKERNAAEDTAFIISTCYQVLTGMLQLVSSERKNCDRAS